MGEIVSPGLSKAIGTKPENVEKHVGEGSQIFEAFEQASAGVIYTLSPFPLNLIFYLGLRIDLAAFLFVILPSLWIIFTVPMLVTIRNYFNSKKNGVVKHRSAYENTPLIRYTCTAPPDWKRHEDGDDGYSDISEEDLASTFDGDYSGMEYADDFESDEQSEHIFSSTNDKVRR